MKWLTVLALLCYILGSLCFILGSSLSLYTVLKQP